MFEKIKKWYGMGIWTKDQVHDAVPDLISGEEYEEINGEVYVEGDPEATVQDYENGMKELGVL